MRNVLGNVLTLTLLGESHGEKIGIVIDGLTAGIFVDDEFILKCLSQRRPQNKGETQRVEKDDYSIVSGVFQHYTTGSPLCILIENQNVHSSDYEKIKDLARPSHVDYVAFKKYHGFADYRGGGHFSGRITAAIVAGGAILLQSLEKLGIKIGCHIKQCGTIQDIDFQNVEEEIDQVNQMNFPVLSDVQDAMFKEIDQATSHNDSIGGIIQTAICGLPSGLGEPWFSSLEGELSRALFGIGGIKGIEFGSGFLFASLLGSKANDCFTIENGKVITMTNHNGGMNGGISNGMPILFNLAVRPTASIAQMQNTIHLKKNTKEKIMITGRHDPAIIRRMNIIVRCLCAFVISDMLMIKYGSDVFSLKKLD